MMSTKRSLPMSREVTDKDKPTLPKRLLNSNLFPESRFLICNSYLPFKVTHDNLAIACDTTNVVLSGDEVPSGASFGSCMMAQKGPCTVVFFHVNTVTDLLAHLRLHLQQHKLKYASSNGKANLELIFPLTLPIEKVKDSLFYRLEYPL